VVAQALLLWLVVYAGLFALAGFVLFMVRGASGRAWSNTFLLRASSGAAFLLSALLWLVLLLVG